MCCVEKRPLRKNSIISIEEEKTPGKNSKHLEKSKTGLYAIASNGIFNTTPNSKGGY